MRKPIKILPLLLILLNYNLQVQSAGDSYSQESVLASGTWFKIAVTSDGIYRIDYTILKQLGLSNPSNPRIFGNNSGQLPYYNDEPKPDDLKELPIYLAAGADGIFNEGDYLLFYGQGTGRWKYDTATGEYRHVRHNYSDTAFYFITAGTAQGKRVDQAESPAGVPAYFSSESDALFIHEMETENLIKSGREWYQPISVISAVKINHGYTDLLTTEKVTFRIRVLGRASVPTLFRLFEGETTLKNLQVNGVNMFNTTGTYAEITDSTGSAFPQSSSPVYEIRFFNNGEQSARGWIDYVTLSGRRKNTFSGSIASYSDYKSIGQGQLTEFTINSPGQDPVIWDITDPFGVKRIDYSRAGNNIIFKASTDTLRRFVAFLPVNAIIPVIKPFPVPNQDLHGTDPADMLIVTHPLFRSYADRLAKIHLANSGLVSLVVTPEEIYNEFSGGIPDIVAIRNFARMKFLQQAGTSHPLKYLLLFGDGSFENKTLPPKNPNFIPTYQSLNSNVVVGSFTSDDFYGLLEDGEGESEGTEDIGIGRFPVSDTIQAGIIISKIAAYLSPSNTGEWKNVICITADDEDGNTHLSDAEGLAAILKDSVPAYNLNKIYLDAFRQVTTINGQSYPEVTSEINNTINDGCLIFNYVGHGNENGLAHERVVRTEDINSWKNGPRLPLFITATCEFSRFDDIELNIITREMTGKTSAGEMVLLNSEGGGIALMSTTRLVYSAPNHFLNKNIYDVAFELDSAGNPLRLGDIIRLAKNKSGTGANKRNFSLLGDPALRLAYPWHGRVITDSINNMPVTGNLDSLKALSLITVTGHIEDMKGVTINGFNGMVSPIVYDKAAAIRTLANDGGPTMEFDLRNSILFSGQTTASGGKFRFTFLVPRDINYSFGYGKISYYAYNATDDMNGSFSQIIVGGFANTTRLDTLGPGIRLFMNDTLFRNGGITDNEPRMLAVLEDEGGINTTGSGIGHDLTAYLDGEQNRTFVLNNYFENEVDNYMKGKVIYDLPYLGAGSHTLTLKAWDNYNNSSVSTILFVVETGGKFILKNLLNYPNPFMNDTRISAGHNRPDRKIEIAINIYDASGRLIRILRSDEFSNGYQLSPVTWDGNDEGGRRVGRGIYPYSVTATTEDGEVARTVGKMIIL
ncbi:MAG: type IX secretion system sortase PorU [Bacteroidales bacterium]|nr:type IX secretion system sortase PorU [Bacteroidales bacterium]